MPVSGTTTRFHRRAIRLRRNTGSNLRKTLLKALAILYRYQIPHWVCGGFAVQEHGFVRSTEDLDLIVPDVEDARLKLVQHGFRSNRGSKMTVTDPDTHIEIDLLPAGKTVHPGTIEFPHPVTISRVPELLSLERLISLKLSSSAASPLKRSKDRTDVIELIMANQPSIDLEVDPRVRQAYQSLWKEMRAEKLI